MTKEEKDLIVLWFNHIEQMATDRKTLNGVVMKPMHALDEIKILAKNSAAFIETFWNKKRSMGIMIQEEQWVSVEEGLPEEKDNEESDMVLVTDGERMFKGHYCYRINDWISIVKKPTHWMPLPKMPKKGGEQ